MLVSTHPTFCGTGLLEWAGFGAFFFLYVESYSHVELAICLPSGDLGLAHLSIGQATVKYFLLRVYLVKEGVL